MMELQLPTIQIPKAKHDFHRLVYVFLDLAAWALVHQRRQSLLPWGRQGPCYAEPQDPSCWTVGTSRVLGVGPGQVRCHAYGSGGDFYQPDWK